MSLNGHEHLLTFLQDDKVGLDDLQDAIAEFEDYVQSSDVSTFWTAITVAMLIIISRSPPCRSYKIIRILRNDSMLTLRLIPTLLESLSIILFLHM